MRHNPTSLAELKSRRRPVRNPNQEYQSRLSALEKAAVFVTEHVGSMGFFLIILCWTVFWLSWNILGPLEKRFDPYPAFVLWLFISNMIQILLMPLIMVGQNLQSKRSEIRAQADFEVNVKAEKEIETILEHLENQQELILKIVKKLEAENQ